jgi:hypothetical protein
VRDSDRQHEPRPAGVVDDMCRRHHPAAPGLILTGTQVACVARMRTARDEHPNPRSRPESVRDLVEFQA